MIPGDLSQLRSASRTVFGQEHLLPVAVALYEAGEPLTMSELVRRVGVNNASSVTRAVKRLTAARFIEQLPRTASDRSRPYRRRESKFWELVLELYQGAPGHEPLF